MIITGGTGNGYSAEVDKENMLLTRAVVDTHIARKSREEGEAFVLPFSQISAGGANDCVFYLKNDSESNLVLSRLWLSCSAADFIYAKYGMVGTAAGGTAPVPVNLNTASAKTALVTTRLHTAVTGLTGGTEVFRAYFAADVIQALKLDDAFVLGPNGVLTLHVLSAAANTLTGNLVFFLHDN